MNGWNPEHNPMQHRCQALPKLRKKEEKKHERPLYKPMFVQYQVPKQEGTITGDVVPQKCTNPPPSPKLFCPGVYTCDWTHSPRARCTSKLQLQSQIIRKFLQGRYDWWQTEGRVWGWTRRTSPPCGPPGHWAAKSFWFWKWNTGTFHTRPDDSQPLTCTQQNPFSHHFLSTKYKVNIPCIISHYYFPNKTPSGWWKNDPRMRGCWTVLSKSISSCWFHYLDLRKNPHTYSKFELLRNQRQNLQVSSIE